MDQATGHVAQVMGSVVDVIFESGEMPEIYEALEIIRPDAQPMILEVQKHLGSGSVRCVSMDSRGVSVRAYSAARSGSGRKTRSHTTSGQALN